MKEHEEWLVRGTTDSLLFVNSSAYNGIFGIEFDDSTNLLLKHYPLLVAKLVKLQGVPTLRTEDATVVRRAEWELFKALRSPQTEPQAPVEVIDDIIEVVKNPSPPFAGDFTHDERALLHGVASAMLVQSVREILPFPHTITAKQCQAIGARAVEQIIVDVDKEIL